MDAYCASCSFIIMGCVKSKPKASQRSLERGVKNEERVSTSEYVVVNLAQVNINLVQIDGDVYYEGSQNTVQRICSNAASMSRGETHIRSCRVRCTNEYCRFHGENHLGECQATYLTASNQQEVGRVQTSDLAKSGYSGSECSNYACLKYGKTHKGKFCSYNCKNYTCEKYGKSHDGQCCLYNCKNYTCIKYGESHDGEYCSYNCKNYTCLKYGKSHDGKICTSDNGKCLGYCDNAQCTHFSTPCSGEHEMMCDDARCNMFSTLHRGAHEYTCSNAHCTKFSTSHQDACEFTCSDAYCLMFSTVHSGAHEI